MAETKKFCIHSDGLGYCDILSGECHPQYCVEGPCPHEQLMEYELVRHGRWVWDENAMDWGLGGWICSECQEKNDNIPAKPDIRPSSWVGSHYCPNCGVKMLPTPPKGE